ncbi:MAG TPA: hypothetical protein VN888_15365 [Mycobacterium sp.]|nr:hypothetical protein [Mycobacterium sp.]
MGRSRSGIQTSETVGGGVYSPLLNGIGGRYFEDCREAEVVDPAVGHGRQQGVAAFALDAQAAAELWEVSLQHLK